jgi:integrase
MKEWVEEYLLDHQSSWSETTLKSERSRLRSLEKYLHMDPAAIYKALVLAGRKPYSIKTIFIRLCSLEAWAVANKKQQETPFKAFMDKHRNKFKYSYSKEEVGLTFQEALLKISSLEEPYRTMALGMLQTGVRISEVYKIKNGKVRGKGGKPRPVYGKLESTAPRSTFSRKLKAVGLKPHDLRKLCATRLAENGASPADLCKAFGWSSINTAYHYLQSKSDEQLEALMKKSTKE